MVLGAGESAASMYSNNADSLQGSENLYLTADGSVKIFTNCDSINNKKQAAYFNTSGNAYFGGNLFVGSNPNQNYIAFYGTTGDNPGSYNHTYIGENFWGGSESSELVLYKGNDIGTSATTVSGSGADRIRHIAGAHLFQIYKSALSGTFDNICKSSVPVNMLAIHQGSIETYAPLYVGGSLNVNGGSDLKLKASSSSNTDPGDLVFADSSGSELARLWKPSVNDLYVRFGSSDSSKIILHSGNFATHLNSTYVNVTGDTMTGRLNITTSGQTMTLGSHNSSYGHIETTADNFYFNKGL